MNVPENISDKETSRTVDGSSKARNLEALAGLLITILLLFVPFWIIAGIALLSLWKDFPPFILGCMVAGSLVICAIIVAGRLIRTKMKGFTRNAKQVVSVLLLLVDAVATGLAFYALTALQNKVDPIYLVENMVRVSKRLQAYQAEHGGYPPRQNVKSLLDTLGIRKSDLRYTFFFDITSAEYHAPDQTEITPENPDEPVLSMVVGRHGLVRCGDRFTLHRGGHVTRVNAGPEQQKPDVEQARDQSIIIPESQK